MALINLQEDTNLWVELPGSYSIAGVDYKRKILVTTLIYNPTNKIVLTEGTVKFFSKNEDDTFGELAPETNIVKDYPVRMVADNTTICNVLDGLPLCSATQLQEIDPNDENSVIFGKNYAYQFEWFFSLAENQQVNIHDMIRNFYMYHWSIGKIN